MSDLVKPNPGTEDVLTKGIERLLIYVGKYGGHVCKWILRVLDQGRRNTILDQIEFINRDAVIGNSGYSMLTQTVRNYLNCC